MVSKKKYFHKFVDKIMDDGEERSSAEIIDKLKTTMVQKDKYGRNRSRRYIPLQRELCYYLKINGQYSHLNIGTRQASWKRKGINEK